MNEHQFEFEWDEIKAAANLHKHGVSFELSATVFSDPRLVTTADLEHGDLEERWLSVGMASNGIILCVVYLWSESNVTTTKVRLISARKATPAEINYYRGGL